MLDLQHVRNIIFDLGNVIIDFDPALTAQAITVHNQNPDSDGWALFKKLTVYEKGDWTDAQFRDFVRSELRNPALTDSQVDEAWNALFLPLRKKRIDLLLELKKKYRTFILSNTNQIHIQHINHMLRVQYPYPVVLDSLVEKVYFSHDIHFVKPEREAYTLILDENHLKASETLFIDDRLENVQAAADLGIKTFHLQPPQTLTEIFAHA
jgi:glucose-1-phosphatase